MANNFYIYAYLNQKKPQTTLIAGVTVRFEPFFVGIAEHSNDKYSAVNLDAVLPIIYNRLLCQKLVRDRKDGFDPSPVIVRDNLSKADAENYLSEIIEKFGRIGKDENGVLCNRRKAVIPSEAVELIEDAPEDQAWAGVSESPYDFPKGHPKGLTKKGNLRRPGTMTEHNKLILAKKLAFGTMPRGSSHWNARHYVLTSPKGEAFEIVGGIKNFADKYNLSHQMLYGYVNKGKIVYDEKKHKSKPHFTERFWNTIGWTVERLEEGRTLPSSGGEPTVIEDRE